MRNAGIATLVAAALALVLSPAAQAATVAVEYETGSRGEPVPLLTYRAEAGEANALLVRNPSDRTFTFEDAGADVTAGNGCQATGPRGAVCRGLRQIVIRLGDGNDALAFEYNPTLRGRGSLAVSGEEGDDSLRATGRPSGRPPHGTFQGGSGNDAIAVSGPITAFGGDGDDTLTGGRFADALIGNRGADRMRAGAGDDWIDETEEDGRPDAIDGGEGTDAIYYGGRTEPVDVSLERGAGPDGGSLRRVEDLEGSGRPDALTGDGRANGLNGAGGDDRLLGRSGDDHLAPGAGADTVDAGSGDDLLRLGSDATADRVACGRGRDVVSVSDALDVLPRDCELLDSASTRIGRFRIHPAVSDEAARWHVACSRRAKRDCEVEIVATSRGEERTSGRRRIELGSTRRLFVDFEGWIGRTVTIEWRWRFVGRSGVSRFAYAIVAREP